MPHTLTITVPAEEVPGVGEVLETLEQVKAEGGRCDDEAGRVRELLDQLAGMVGPAELTGPARLVRDAAYGLLLDGADALAEACRRYEAGEIELPALVAAGASAGRRLDLFAEVERLDAVA